MGLRDHLATGAQSDADRLGIRSEAVPYFGVIKSALSDAGQPFGQEQMARLADDVLDALSGEAVID